MINTENERLLTANQNQHHLNTNQNDNENDSLVSSSDNGSDTSKQNTTKKGSKYQKKEDEIIFGGRFECNRNLLLGSGTFGEIYFGIDTLQKEYVAVKLEKPTAKEPQLRNEKMILDLMNEDEFLGIYVRSSLGIKYNIRLCNQVGIIDYDYYNNIDNEGHIFVRLCNEGDKTVVLKKDDRSVQGIFQKYYIVNDEEKIENNRTGGFGSTNKGDDNNE